MAVSAILIKLSVFGLQKSRHVSLSAPAICRIYDDIIALWMLQGLTCAPKIPNLRVLTLNLLNDLTYSHPIDPPGAIGAFTVGSFWLDDHLASEERAGALKHGSSRTY